LRTTGPISTAPQAFGFRSPRQDGGEGGEQDACLRPARCSPFATHQFQFLHGVCLRHETCCVANCHSFY
jgi:hypothetical protein